MKFLLLFIFTFLYNGLSRPSFSQLFSYFLHSHFQISQAPILYILFYLDSLLLFFRLAHEQAERALRDCHSNQGHLNKELSANLDRIQALESEVTTLDRELQNVKIERNTLRTNLKQLDQQKDFLLVNIFSFYFLA